MYLEDVVIKLNLISSNSFYNIEPWFIIQNDDLVYNSKVQRKIIIFIKNLKKTIKMKYYKQESHIEFILEYICVKGDFLIAFYNNSLMNSKVSFK